MKTNAETQARFYQRVGEIALLVNDLRALIPPFAIGERVLVNALQDALARYGDPQKRAKLSKSEQRRIDLQKGGQ